MPPQPKGKDLFIVDNSVSGWTGLRYLEEWAGIAKAFDIVKGSFWNGGLMVLNGLHIQIVKDANRPVHSFK